MAMTSILLSILLALGSVLAPMGATMPDQYQQLTIANPVVKIVANGQTTTLADLSGLSLTLGMGYDATGAKGSASLQLANGGAAFLDADVYTENGQALIAVAGLSKPVLMTLEAAGIDASALSGYSDATNGASEMIRTLLSLVTYGEENTQEQVSIFGETQTAIHTTFTIPQAPLDALLAKGGAAIAKAGSMAGKSLSGLSALTAGGNTVSGDAWVVGEELVRFEGVWSNNAISGVKFVVEGKVTDAEGKFAMNVTLADGRTAEATLNFANQLYEDGSANQTLGMSAKTAGTYAYAQLVSTKGAEAEGVTPVGGALTVGLDRGETSYALSATYDGSSVKSETGATTDAGTLDMYLAAGASDYVLALDVEMLKDASAGHLLSGDATGALDYANASEEDLAALNKELTALNTTILAGVMSNEGLMAFLNTDMSQISAMFGYGAAATQQAG